MVDKKLSDFSKALCARPITLKFSRQAKPGNRLSSRSHHAADSHIVCFRRDAARGVGDDVRVMYSSLYLRDAAISKELDAGHEA